MEAKRQRKKNSRKQRQK